MIASHGCNDHRHDHYNRYIRNILRRPQRNGTKRDNYNGYHEYWHDDFVPLYTVGLSPPSGFVVRKGEPDWYHQSRAVSEWRPANAININSNRAAARGRRGLSAFFALPQHAWHPTGLHGSRVADAMVESWKCSSDGTGPGEKKRLARGIGVSRARLWYNELDDPRN